MRLQSSSTYPSAFMLNEPLLRVDVDHRPPAAAEEVLEAHL